MDVGLPQYVLVPDDVDLDGAVPDGSWDEFTDLNRWYTPGSTPDATVQYCADDTDVALARLRTMAAQSGADLDDLIAGPGLLDVTVDITDAADLTGPVTLSELGLPDYPAGANTPAARAACAVAGNRFVAGQERLIVVRPAEAQVSVNREVLAVLPRVRLGVARRRRWPHW